MDADYLVVDQSLHDVEDAPAGEDESEMRLQFGARRPGRQIVIAAIEAARTRTQVAK
jgi:hypothetical protein